MVEIEIDGKKVEVAPGTMLLEAANKIGTYIPHFCYHKKLSIAANCRMCLVEVEKAPKPLPACATPVSAGMIVRSNSEKAVQAQKSVMEFLLINHPLDCPICDQGGECQLQDLAVGYGSGKSRYEEEKRVVVPKEAGPLVSMEEMARCIQCTRCVRFGQEVAGVMELGMVGRGEHSEITTFVGKTIDSEVSGNMIDLCPVGALTSKPFRYSARPWELSRRKSVSPHDSLGSNLIVQVKNGKVMRVLPLENEAINECWLSDKDRFSYEALDNADRLTVPMIKQGGQWAETDWQTALEYVAHGLRNIKHEHGAESIAAAATAHSTVEELYLLQKAMRGLGTEHIDFRLRQGDFALDGAVTPWLGMPISELSNVASAFVIGSNLRKDHPLVATRLRNAIKNGAKLAVLGGTDDDLLMTTAAKIVAAPSDWLAALSDVVAAVAAAKEIEAPAGFNNITATDNAKAIAATFAKEGAVVLLGNAVSHHPQGAAIHAAAQWLASTTGAKFGYLVEAANTVGGYLVNATSNKDLFATPKKAYVLLNAEPELDAANPQQARAALDGAEMVVAMSAFKHGFDYADVLLPIAPFSETAGTFVNCEGRAQSFNGTVKPLGEARPAWKVLRVLGNLLGVAGFDYDTSEAVRDEALGKGVTDLSGKLNNIGKTTIQAAAYGNAGALERVTDVPIYFTDAIARRSEPLQRTADANIALVTLPRALAAELNVVAGDRVQVTQGSGTAILVADIDARLPVNAIRVAAGHPLTATLGAMFGPIAVQKAGEAA
jgi:NADH-quinone oxidoreductase subunit G